MLCEPVWMHDGVDKREWFEKGLEPDILADDLKRYKMLCSKDFNMSDLLKLKEIQALALLAEAIIDLPEYLTDKIGKCAWIFQSILSPEVWMKSEML